MGRLLEKLNKVKITDKEILVLIPVKGSSERVYKYVQGIINGRKNADT
jgi:hypothetical protein